ncbi:MAG: Zn-dependent hydrolase [Gemmatimonadetes bacterium]|nr:Zn-dependent hydrolase [Gemmatimonadota bacterium]
MNRQAFTRAALAAVGALLAGGPGGRGQERPRVRVNGARVTEQLRALAEFGKNPEGGVSRVAYSEADRAGREYVLGLMRTAGLDPKTDYAGNLIGRRAGSSPGAAPIMLGSHIDSVPNGGNYDGPVGAIGAIEVARALTEAGITTQHPLEVAIFSNEEGGKTGSRAISGELADKELDLVTASGRTVRDGIAFIDGDPGRLASARRRPGDVAAFLELHVEQGAILQRGGIAIGVVEGIVGIKRWNVTVEGFANHAGTTPMDARQDAMVAAARFIEAVPRVVTRTPGRQVGTVGRIQAFPGAPNVIPGRVALSLELRDLDMPKIDRILEDLRAEAQRIGALNGTIFRFDEFYVSHAAPTDERIRRLIEEAASELGLSTLRMPSGAGHDAQSIAQLAPVGMVFVPSVEGISHSPSEFSHPDAIAAGVNVLLHTLLKLDATFGAR